MMKFHKTLLLIVCIIVIISSCKKDDNSPGGGSNFIIPMQPPVGYSFPKTYSQKQNKTDFHVWLSNSDKTNLFTPRYFFKDSIIWNYFNIKFDNITSMEIIDPTGKNPAIPCNYYFFRDTLYVINLFPDTLPFAYGDFTSFEMSDFHFYLTGTRDGTGGYSTVSGSNMFALSKDMLTAKYASWISQFDTIALYNYSVTLR